MQAYLRQQQASFSQFWENHQVPLLEPVDAFILHSSQWKDHHRHLIFLTRDYGLASAFLYGAASRKNPYRASAQPCSFGHVSFKQGGRVGAGLQVAEWQISEPSLTLAGLHGPHLEVFRHCSLWSEILLHSHGLGQESSLLFGEIRALISRLLASPNEFMGFNAQVATLRFIWQFLIAEGINLGMGNCQHCEAPQIPLLDPVFFTNKGQVLCYKCSRGREGYFLTSEELNFLCWAELEYGEEAASMQHESAALRVESGNFGAERMVRALIAGLEELFNCPLKAAVDVYKRA